MRSLFLFLLLLKTASACAGETDARQLVKDAMDHWRGLTSYSEFTMTIHRPGWERKMTMRAWSEGDKLSLVRVIEPKKDAGNGTLLNDNNMWSYSPSRFPRRPQHQQQYSGARPGTAFCTGKPGSCGGVFFTNQLTPF